MAHVDAVLRAYDVLEIALAADTIRDAAAAVRADIEVLDRDELVTVATAITVESTRQLLGPAEAKRLQKWLRFARLEHMWNASVDEEADS